MKANQKAIGIIMVSMVVLLNAYLIHLNIGVSKFQTAKEYNSTGNYIQITDDEEDIIAVSDVTTDEEVVKEEIVDEETTLYDGKTIIELTETINKSLNSTISGKGELIVSYSIEKGVDPYLATAIILHETGCKWGCSRLVRECNNVGGQKGQGCGSYAYFNSLDEGIRRFIDNLYKNYISCGLTTPETINPKYAEDPNWAGYVSKYIENIKAL